MSKQQCATIFFAGAVALSATARSSAKADEALCAVLDQILADRSVRAMKANLIGFDRWNTAFAMDSFNRCTIVAIPKDTDPTMTSTDAVECEVWMDGLERARTLRDNSLEALSCGAESFPIPGLSTESRNLFFPTSGLALSADVQPRGLDFTLWRDELRQGDPRTTAYEYKVTISIQAIFPKP